MMQIRQGDVLLIKVESFPKDISRKDNVLARGEVTGHSHRFESQCVQVFEDKSKQQFVDVGSDSDLIHEEHSVLKIPKGKYKVVIQQEYDLLKGVKQVMD